MRSLQNDRSVVIKPADKGSAVVVWDRNDYLKEAERQLSDEKTYEEIRITEKDQVELVEKSNDLFSNLKRKNVITENENNYFRFNFKKLTNLGKLYLLPNTQRSWQGTWKTSHFQLWNPYRKSFRILGLPFTAYNETRRVLYKKHRTFFS